MSARWGERVRSWDEELGITRCFLPGYRPNLNAKDASRRKVTQRKIFANLCAGFASFAVYFQSLVGLFSRKPYPSDSDVFQSHTTRNSGFSRIFLKVCRNFAPVAPSTTRWSHDNVTRIICRTTTSSLLTTGFGDMAPTARIAPSGGLITAVNS